MERTLVHHLPCSCSRLFSAAGRNACAVQNGGCMHDCRLDGTTLYCECRVGFILAEDRKTCQGKLTHISCSRLLVASFHNKMHQTTLYVRSGLLLLLCVFLSQTSMSARRKPATVRTAATTRWALTCACAMRPTSWDLTENSATVRSMSENHRYHPSPSLAADDTFHEGTLSQPF